MPGLGPLHRTPPFFGHKRLVQLLTAHVRQPLPELRPSFDIPEGFEGWMRRLLEKLASERFQNAADARESLRRLVKGDASVAKPDD